MSDERGASVIFEGGRGPELPFGVLPKQAPPHPLARYAGMFPADQRPSCREDVAQQFAIRQIAVKAAEWSAAGGGDSKLEEIERDIAKAANRAFDGDGFALASELKDLGWDGVDKTLVDILDELGDEEIRAHQALVKAWVALHGIECPFAVGDQVEFEDRASFSRDGQVRTGEVVSIHLKTAEVVVYVPALGHIHPSMGKVSGTRGVLLGYERVRPAQAPITQAAMPF